MKPYPPLTARMPQTRESSKKVGMILKIKALRTEAMPREPLSIVLDSAPVWRFKWKVYMEKEGIKQDVCS